MQRSRVATFLASRRQPIILSSDDNRSLRIIVCYYRWGRNRCWAIRTLYGFKRRNNGLICNYGSDHVHMSGSVGQCLIKIKERKIHCCYFYRIWQMHGMTSGSLYTVRAQMVSMKAICIRFRAHRTPLTSDTVHPQEIFTHKWGQAKHCDVLARQFPKIRAMATGFSKSVCVDCECCQPVRLELEFLK